MRGQDQRLEQRPGKSRPGHGRDPQAELDAIVNTIDEGVVMTDASGIITLFNPACERQFGYRRDEVVGRNVAILMPPAEREAHDSRIRAYRETGTPRILGRSRDVVGRRKDGTSFPIELTVGEANVGEGSVLIGVIKDISRRRRDEQRLRELHDELLHASRLSAMGQMSASLAHELNQPLTAIANYIQAARRMLLQGSDANLARASETMEKAAAQTIRAGQVIRRLREFAAKGVTRHARGDLNVIVRDASQLALVGAVERGVTVTMRLAPMPVWVDVDAIQIQQVIHNLVRNALDAMENQPERTITIATQTTPDGMARTTVIDTGAGLDAAVAQRLFQPFMTTKPAGLGLGLSICRSIVVSHGGRIWAEPGDGRGTAFHFTLPLSRSDHGDPGA